MKKRQFDPDTKVAVALEGLKGETSIAELCRKHQMNKNMYYKWRDKFLDGGRKAFATNGSNAGKHLEKKDIRTCKSHWQTGNLQEILKNIKDDIDLYKTGAMLHKGEGDIRLIPARLKSQPSTEGGQGIF